MKTTKNQGVIASPANEMSGIKQSPNLMQTSMIGLLRPDSALRLMPSGLAMTVAAIAFILSSCSRDPKSTGLNYMPDMAYSPAYETYTENPNFKDDSMTARKPVAGTIPRGQLPANLDGDVSKSYLLKRYYPETNEGYEAAGLELVNPLATTDDVLARGKQVYEIYCMVCHGEKGNGDGSIVVLEGGKEGAFPPVPAYSTRLPGLAEGKMFHSITYGRNLMGSYAGLSVEDRWRVVHYIQKLSGTGRFAATTTDTTAIKTN